MTYFKKNILSLILLLALILRLPLLNGSFWLDEAAQALESTRPFSQQLDIIPDFQPPLLHYLVHFASYFSQAEWWLRLWGALIPGLVTIWATYKIGLKLFSPKVATWATLLLATSSFHIFFSQELRPYSLSAMWGMLATLALITEPFSFWKFTLPSLAGLYTSYLYPFLLLAHLLLLWLKKHSLRPSFFVGITLGLFYAPWLPTFFQQLRAGQNLRVEIPGWETVVSTPQLKALLLVPLKFIFGVVNIEMSWPFLLALILLGVSILFILSSCAQLFSFTRFSLWTNLLKTLQNFPKKTRKLSSWEILFILLILPLLVSWLISFFVPVVQPKRVIYLLPFFMLLCASVLDWVPNTSKKIANFFLTLLLFINIWSTACYWKVPTLQRENWRSLKQEIVTQFPASSTIVIMSFDEPFAPWRWYGPLDYPTLVTGQQALGENDDLKETLKPVFDKQYVLVFDYLRTLTDPQDKVLTTLTDFGFVGRGVIDYPGIGFVRIYTRPESAISFLPRMP